MDFKDDATMFHLECHQGHKNDGNRGSVATAASVGMTTTFPWVPSAPVARHRKGQTACGKDHWLGEVLHNPEERGRGGRGGAAAQQGNTARGEEGCAATAPPDPRQAGTCERRLWPGSESKHLTAGTRGRTGRSRDEERLEPGYLFLYV